MIVRALHPADFGQSVTNLFHLNQGWFIVVPNSTAEM